VNTSLRPSSSLAQPNGPVRHSSPCEAGVGTVYWEQHYSPSWHGLYPVDKESIQKVVWNRCDTSWFLEWKDRKIGTCATFSKSEWLVFDQCWQFSSIRKLDSKCSRVLSNLESMCALNPSESMEQIHIFYLVRLASYCRQGYQLCNPHNFLSGSFIDRLESFMVLFTYQGAQSSCSALCDVCIPYSGLIRTLHRTTLRGCKCMLVVQ
jgi:hypothetical protein